MEEILKDIPGYEGLYQVSNTGRVFSLLKNKFLSLNSLNKEYKRIDLHINGERKSFLIHRLVMLAFIGPSYLQVNHIDGNKLNNNLNNLEYVTNQQNQTHAWKNGLKTGRKGEKTNFSKLTEKEVNDIRQLIFNGIKIKEIAKKYQVCYTTISSIKNNKTWRII